MQQFEETASVVTVLSSKDRLLQNNEFLVMLAHELRNPLAPIKNSLALIEGNSGDNVLLLNAYRVLDRQVNNMVSIIDNLLDIARLAADKLYLNKDIIDLGSIIDKAIQESKSTVDSRRHSLNVVMPDETIWVNGDAHRLQKAISSLILNAAKFTDTNGKISITVSYNDTEALISIKDTGIGIHQDALPHVFELFTQVDNPVRMSQGGGLGVGLTLTQGVIRLHEGEVEAYSEGIGKGSEFIIYLPICKIGGSPEKNNVLESSGQKKHQRAYDILVVDDHIDTAESTAVLLKMLGHKTRIAHSGFGALQQAMLYNPDVVLLDIGMPDMDGYQVGKQLRAEYPDMLLIAVTGYGQEIDKRRSFLAGFDKHLVKPIEPNALPAILNTPREVLKSHD